MHSLQARLSLALLLAASTLCGACGDDPAPGKADLPPSTTPKEESSSKANPATRGDPDDMSGSPDGVSAVAEDLAPLPEPASTESDPAGPSVADSLEAFHARMEQLIAACRGDAARAEADARALLLPAPKAWFEHAFGADSERVPVLVKEYEGRAAQLAQLPKAIHARIDAGQSEAQTERFIDGGDELATGYQAIALRAMQEPIALYSLRLMEADADGGWHLWSFAHVDGQFRFVGQMTALTPTTVDKLVRQLNSLRVKDAREVQEGWKEK